MGYLKPIAAAIVLGMGLAAGAQQISRIAVIDFPRIVMAFARDPLAYKEFEARKSQMQTEIDRMSVEIKKFQAQQADAEAANDAQTALKLKGEIDKKTAVKNNFWKAKSAELDDMARKITAATPEISTIYRYIEQYAEGEGYSLVLNLKAADYVMGSVIWYSSMIDITDQIIQNLSAKYSVTNP
jgi:Skp family chaperone for outer membrane proteins